MTPRTEPGGVVLICHNSGFGRAMARAMQAGLGRDFAGVLAIHRPQSRLKAWTARLRFALRASRMERRIRRIETRLAHEAEHAFDIAVDPPRGWPDGLDVHYTPDPNGSECVDWLSARAPDLIVVTGAPLLCEAVFGLPRLGTINMHSSLLPHYRGTQAEFWQVLEGAWHTCGITVHFIDAGVDTGGILAQVPAKVTGSVTPQMLRSRNLIQALHTVPDTAARVLQGDVHVQPQTGGGRPRRSRDRTLELRTELLAKLGYLGPQAPRNPSNVHAGQAR
ncbi:formyltransferase family protein [Marivita sp. GX14005]|uniref:formyltransferase family protein n=1 Tax=Marivita sp. GX14005 TaxID=2942276 RepID=UPI002019D3DC|nr:formyltransferase family protein [Marivita sp. GX14005]MCL3881748.1 hypothetical protein [Marivita sp. GX14005]